MYAPFEISKETAEKQVSFLYEVNTLWSLVGQAGLQDKPDPHTNWQLICVSWVVV